MDNKTQHSHECQICYDLIINDDSMVVLECSHSLCEDCLNKLVVQICPFCRHPISLPSSHKEEDSNEEDDEEDEFVYSIPSYPQNSWPPQSRLRRRQRHTILQQNSRLEHQLGYYQNEWSNDNMTQWQMNRLLRQRVRHRHIINVWKEKVEVSGDMRDEWDELIFYMVNVSGSFS